MILSPKIILTQKYNIFSNKTIPVEKIINKTFVYIKNFFYIWLIKQTSKTMFLEIDSNTQLNPRYIKRVYGCMIYDVPFDPEFKNVETRVFSDREISDGLMGTASVYRFKDGVMRNTYSLLKFKIGIVYDIGEGKERSHEITFNQNDRDTYNKELKRITDLVNND